ncbi:hypothetical protein HI914_04583 [Erysiphe necator]|nr:hypothetical protein HI914_04583 [Erysiphe necator]
MKSFHSLFDQFNLHVEISGLYPQFPTQQENKTSSPPSPPSVPIITDDKWPQESTELIDLTNDKKSQQLPNFEDSSDDGSEYIPSYLSVQESARTANSTREGT